MFSSSSAESAYSSISNVRDTSYTCLIGLYFFKSFGVVCGVISTFVFALVGELLGFLDFSSAAKVCFLFWSFFGRF